MYMDVAVTMGPTISQGLYPVLLRKRPLTMAVMAIPATIAKEYSAAFSVFPSMSMVTANMEE